MATSKAKGSTTATPSHHASTSTSTSSGGGNHGSGTGGNSGSGGGSRGGESSSTVTASSSKHHNNTNITGETHAKRLSKGKELVGKEIPTLDFNTLDISVLRRYKRIHKLKVKDYATKEELVTAVSRHYTSQSVKEVDVIAAFVYTVHNKDNVLKLQIP
ncbi:Sin3 binding region of histone deacetylase complex subunit SAP30-domain-containing protein [Rhizophagus diaphanus]|nr:Sin3 binding region of histone deacetylase complex subunit SAP30-domain-containing protein [Rhizophagus diaphanus] [Rhizophagus sp. MUCL 43196]